jgi:hypothetical protein
MMQLFKITYNFSVIDIQINYYYYYYKLLISVRQLIEILF